MELRSVTSLSHIGGPQRDTHYLFSVQEDMGGSNVIVSLTVRPQSLKAEDDHFPPHFQVFKVRQPAAGLSLGTFLPAGESLLPGWEI